MLNCKISKVPTLQCDLNIGGVKRMAIANYSPTYIYNYATGGDCTITGIDLRDENFYPLPIAEGTGYANANLAAGANKDSKAINHQVGGLIPQVDCNVIDDWKNYILGNVIFAVETNNGDVYLYGARRGLTATNFDFATGTGESDANGITFLYEGLQQAQPLKLESWGIIQGLFPE